MVKWDEADAWPWTVDTDSANSARKAEEDKSVELSDLADVVKPRTETRESSAGESTEDGEFPTWDTRAKDEWFEDQWDGELLEEFEILTNEEWLSEEEWSAKEEWCEQESSDVEECSDERETCEEDSSCVEDESEETSWEERESQEDHTLRKSDGRDAKLGSREESLKEVRDKPCWEQEEPDG